MRETAMLTEAVLDDPLDYTAWMVLADTLEDSGKEEQAQLLRLRTKLLQAQYVYRKDQFSIDRKHDEQEMQELLKVGVEPFNVQYGTVDGTRFSLIPYPKKPFLMATTTVTKSHYGVRQDTPVVNVRLSDCHRHIQKLNELSNTIIVRLPTFDEWDFACRAGTLSRCYLGATLEDLDLVAWHSKNSGVPPRLSDVGLKLPNAFGLYDMLGNVNEWTSTSHNGCHQLCGGHYDTTRQNCLPGWYSSTRFDQSYPTLGFRLAADVLDRRW